MVSVSGFRPCQSPAARRTVHLVAAALILAPHACTGFRTHVVRRGRFPGRGSARRPRPDAFARFSFSNGGDGGDEEPSEDEKGGIEGRRRATSSPSDEFAVLDADEIPRPIRKFAGTGTPSLFSSESSRERPASANVTREREREFELAGNFERTLGAQAAILLASAAIVAAVGLAGGITDGSDRHFGGDDEVDERAIERYSRTDDAAEVVLRRESAQGSQWL